MRAVAKTLKLVAPKDVAITLVGESGSGKEVVARLVHSLSARRSGPFIPINCAAIPDLLFESELFGHERGAFTGASQMARGKVEAAQGGTLFLDEIGELPPSLQAKLLRFIENRKFMRVGGTAKIDADVRLLFATHRPLEHHVQAGTFRSDLFYRIQGITIDVPPLRERRADILPLIREFLQQFSTRHAVRPPRLSRRAKERLIAHDWPGNVRELRNVIESLCLLRPGRPVGPEDLPSMIARSGEPEAVRRVASGETLRVSLADSLDAITARIVTAVLAAESGNKQRAAVRLGISLRTVQRHVATGRVASVAQRNVMRR
jgi:transcriptional regulator with PAS, ATPase and Fis domain